jgi:hypothetical protein
MSFTNKNKALTFSYDGETAKVRKTKYGFELNKSFEKLYKKAYINNSVNYKEVPTFIRNNYIYNANKMSFLLKEDSKQFFNKDGSLNKTSIKKGFVYYPKENILINQEFSLGEEEYKKDLKKITKFNYNDKTSKITFKKSIKTLMKQSLKFNINDKKSSLRKDGNYIIEKEYLIDTKVSVNYDVYFMYAVCKNFMEKVDDTRIIQLYYESETDNSISKFIKYKTGNFSFEKFKENYNKLTDNYHHLVLKSIKLLKFQLPKRGGCCERSTSKLMSVSKQMRCAIIDPKSKNNNCLIACFIKALGLNGNKVKPDIIRQKVGLKQNEMIETKDIHLIADYFECGFMVINELNTKPLLVHNLFRDVIVQLLLITEHYQLINDVEKEIKICAHCFKKYTEKHNCIIDNPDKKHCNKCGKDYLKTHNCNITNITFYKSINSRKRREKPDIISVKNIKTKKIDYRDIIFFDLETFQEYNNHVVYACGWYNKVYKQDYGKNSMNGFVDEMIKQKNKTIVAYNGSGFDFHFLMKELIKRGIEIEKPILNNGKLMSFQFGSNKVFDLYLFLTSSLENAGKSFNLDIQKSKFDHSKMKTWGDVETYRTEVEPYLKTDVMVLRELFIKFNDMIFKYEQINITKYITLSHLTYSVFTSDNYLNECIEVFTDIEKYRFVKRAIYGGRTYPMKKEFKSKYYDDVVNGKMTHEELIKTKDYMYNADVCSLYPSAMVGVDYIKEDFYYPVGLSIWVNDKDECKKHVENGDLGYFEIKYSPPKNKRIATLPSHSDKGGLDWTLEDGQGVYTTVDIRNAIENGYTIEYTDKGLVWLEKSKTLFTTYINRYIGLKKQAEIDNNPVLRQIAKLMMNGLYGKLLQNAITSQQKFCYNMNDIWEFMVDYEIEDWVMFDDCILLKGEIKEDLEIDKVKKPIQLGGFVLSYSRKIMLHLMKEINPNLDTCLLTYTDTDSLHITGENHLKLKEKGLIVEDSKLGYLNNDIKNEGLIIYEKNLAPKSYMYEYVNNKQEKNTTMKCKGIPNQLLRSEFYKNETHDEVEFSGLKKKHINLTKKDKENNLENFSIVNSHQTRTFNKTDWSNMDFNENQWYPRGYNEIACCC